MGQGWSCNRADDYSEPGVVTEKIVYSILNSDLVIGLVPDFRAENSINPNVMYELGIAHSFRKPSVVIADERSALPFDVRDVETIALDFSRYRREADQTGFLRDLRERLHSALATPETLSLPSQRRPPRNPVTMHLAEANIFIEDLPWLWGYSKVLERERGASTVWEITRDLYWPGEVLFLESIKEAIRDHRKHYFLVPDEDEVLRTAEAVMKQLSQEGLPADEIERHLHFVAIDKKHFVLWPISIVLYDADLAGRRGGIICEPMESEVGHDSWDQEIRDLYARQGHATSIGDFQSFLGDLDWVQKRREKTFDIRLDPRVVSSLATAFEKIWNQNIIEEAQRQRSETDRAQLLKVWLIQGGAA